MSDMLQIARDVRAGDYDRFLAIQLAPADKRGALYTLTAFSIELAKIAETVSEPMLGHIRLAWWREALEEIAAGKAPRSHPVVQALSAVYAADPRLFTFLFEMIDARAADLDPELIAEEAQWLTYLDGTAGALFRGWQCVLAPACVESVADTARSYAIIGLLRAIPYMQREGWIRFPKACPGTEALVPGEALTRFVATRRLQAQQGLGKMPKAKHILPLYALDQLAIRHASALKKAGDNPYRLRARQLGSVVFIIWINYF